MKRLLGLFAKTLLIASAWCLAGAANAQTNGGDGHPIYSVNAKSTQPKFEREAAGSGHVPHNVSKFWFKYTDGKYERGDRGAGNNIRLDGKIRDKAELGFFETAELEPLPGEQTASCYTTPVTVLGFWQPYRTEGGGETGQTGWDFIVTGFEGGETVCS